MTLHQARGHADCTIWRVELFLSTQTKNVNTNTKKTKYSVIENYVIMVSEIIF